MEIYIDNRQDKIEIDENMVEILKLAIKESLLLEKGATDYEISISIVDNVEIRLLNREYRNIDKETDVLSFPLNDEFGDIPMLGDIIISGEKALEQSIEYGHSLIREMAYLTVHSMFHLMGYDHMVDEDKAIMRNKEKKVMNNIGIFRKKGDE
ncbi:MAG: rRNA maturation RNase YbeY [Tissierellia bacterium]|nr:rRNA maturation RNase YbeY [Tissierellia bacterium]